MLDSGAFSAWAQRTQIKLSEYIAFIKKYDDCLHDVVNLDVIPGKYGTTPTVDEVEDSARKGWKNLTQLDREGIEVIPVYHQGERPYWLDKMIDEQYEYIGISPANDRTTKEKKAWLDGVFSHLCGDNDFPEIKPHGFGVTALPLLRRYPWYSVDSATWLLVGGNGEIMVPRWDRQRDQYDYTTSPDYIRVSGRDEGRSTSITSQHLSSLSPSHREYIMKYIAAEDFDLEQLRNNHYYRERANCRFFKRVVENYTLRPFVHRPHVFFQEPQRRGSAECGWDTLRMMFVTTTDPGQADVLSNEGVKDRLLSYFNFKGGESTWFDVREYVKVGRMRNPRAKRVSGFFDQS